MIACINVFVLSVLIEWVYSEASKKRRTHLNSKAKPLMQLQQSFAYRGNKFISFIPALPLFKPPLNLFSLLMISRRPYMMEVQTSQSCPISNASSSSSLAKRQAKSSSKTTLPASLPSASWIQKQCWGLCSTGSTETVMSESLWKI